MNVLRPMMIPLIAVAGLITTVANAGVVTFTGFDAGANSTDPRPNSDSTAASFDAAAGALGTLSLITFESAPVGNFTSLTIAPGVTLTGSIFASGQAILNTPFGNPDSDFGYNTTSGGSNFVFSSQGLLTFSFTTPISAFGAYLTGVQADGETITFNDGTSQTVAIPNPGLSGGVDFVGFTDAGALISSLAINPTIFEGVDFIGVDDVRFVGGFSTTTPLPAALPLFATGIGGLGLFCWRRKREAPSRNGIWKVRR